MLLSAPIFQIEVYQIVLNFLTTSLIQNVLICGISILPMSLQHVFLIISSSPVKLHSLFHSQEMLIQVLSVDN